MLADFEVKILITPIFGTLVIAIATVASDSHFCVTAAIKNVCIDYNVEGNFAQLILFISCTYYKSKVCKSGSEVVGDTKKSCPGVRSATLNPQSLDYKEPVHYRIYHPTAQ